MTETPLTVPEVAAHLRCTDWTVRVMARRGDLRASLIGGRWLFQPSDVQAYLDERENRPVARRRRRRAS